MDRKQRGEGEEEGITILQKERIAHTPACAASTYRAIDLAWSDGSIGKVVRALVATELPAVKKHVVGTSLQYEYIW